MQQEPVTFSTSDGVRLEGRLALPPEPAGAAIVCHPHPQYEGSMSSLLIPMIQRAIAAAGWAALRFNFRGVGRSEGRYEGGLGEQQDAAAALELLASRTPGVPLAASGWSFGALVALAAAAGDPRVVRYVAVAPPVDAVEATGITIEPPAERLAAWPVRALALIGDRDAFATPASTERWATAMLEDRMQVEVIAGADHGFNGLQHPLADRVAAFITSP